MRRWGDGEWRGWACSWGCGGAWDMGCGASPEGPASHVIWPCVRERLPGLLRGFSSMLKQENTLRQRRERVRRCEEATAGQLMRGEVWWRTGRALRGVRGGAFERAQSHLRALIVGSDRPRILAIL